MSKSNIAVVRHHVSRIDGVSRTWFEWESVKDSWTKTLVVEVNFDTDPNATEFRQNVLDAIEETAKTVLKEETTMIVSRLKVVPKLG